MPSGPQHYAEAEQLLEQADEWLNGEDAPDSFELVHARRAEDMAAAQVHATLALAAATALVPSEVGAPEYRDYQEWRAVAGNTDNATGPALVWWLDDGHENPDAPTLYLDYGHALEAGVSRFREANFPELQDTRLVWADMPDEDGPGVELIAAGRATGITLRPIRPKDGA